MNLNVVNSLQATRSLRWSIQLPVPMDNQERDSHAPVVVDQPITKQWRERRYHTLTFHEIASRLCFHTGKLLTHCLLAHYTSPFRTFKRENMWNVEGRIAYTLYLLANRKAMYQSTRTLMRLRSALNVWKLKSCHHLTFFSGMEVVHGSTFGCVPYSLSTSFFR